MAIVSAGGLQLYTQENDAPTSSQFADAWASFVHKTSAAGTAQTVRSLGVGAAGSSMFAAATTAAERSLLGLIAGEAATTASAQMLAGGGTVGMTVFEAATTASAQTVVGGGAVGRTVFEAATTASAQSLIAIRAATTAQAAAGVNASSQFMTPDTIRFSQFAARAYVTFNSAGAILVSERVSSVTHEAAGKYKVKWSPALATSRAALTLAANGASNGDTIVLSLDVSGANTVSAQDLLFEDNANTAGVDPSVHASIVAFCSGL